MAAKRVKTTTVKEELPAEPDQSVDMSGDLSNLGLLLQQFPESTLSVEVYKDELGHWDYCETLRGTYQIDKDAIRDTWGGGKFELRVFDNGVPESTISFRVANRKTPAPANGNNASIDMMREQNAFYQKMLLTLLASRSDGPSFKDMIDILSKNNHAASPEKTMEVLMRGMELGKGNGPASNDWKAELIHAVSDLGKAVIPSVVEIAAQRNHGSNGNGHPQIPATADAILKQGIRELKTKVIQGLPVGLALDWIIGNAHEYEPLLKALMQAGYERIEAMDAELKNEPFKTWFTTLYQGLHHAYTNNSTDANSDGTAGNMGNVADDDDTGA